VKKNHIHYSPSAASGGQAGSDVFLQIAGREKSFIVFADSPAEKKEWCLKLCDAMVARQAPRRQGVVDTVTNSVGNSLAQSRSGRALMAQAEAEADGEGGGDGGEGGRVKGEAPIQEELSDTSDDDDAAYDSSSGGGAERGGDHRHNRRQHRRNQKKIKEQTSKQSQQTKRVCPGGGGGDGGGDEHIGAGGLRRGGSQVDVVAPIMVAGHRGNKPRQCAICQRRFTMLRKPVNCGNCGTPVCDNCSRSRRW
jgi:hypothetical protein